MASVTLRILLAIGAVLGALAAAGLAEPPPIVVALLSEAVR